ncbi:MAG: (d)CMP kinase [Elusimicrobia bacterium]|nr:(d)CMP kinase [Elusimicrobiota bacterium]
MIRDGGWAKEEWSSVVAIDGPAGVGKSTVARLVAKELKFLFINTGDMYRALTWKALREGVDIRKQRDVAEFLHLKMNWEFQAQDGHLKIRLDGKELGRELRSERVSKLTPTAAQWPQVRSLLRRLQRNLAGEGRAVLEGRDITTHVTPKAGLKVFLDAKLEERAKRRYRQLIEDGKRVKFDSVQENVRLRDWREKKNKIMPNRRSPGTIVMDTTHLNLHEVAAKILELYHEKARGG